VETPPGDPGYSPELNRYFLYTRSNLLAHQLT